MRLAAGPFIQEALRVTRDDLQAPKLSVDKAYFCNRGEALEDIRKTGYWPYTFVSTAAPELPVHYHDHDIIGYVIEGTTYLLDESHERIGISAGDRLVIPKGAWHAEGEVTERVVYLVSVREPVPLFEAITPQEARGPIPIERKRRPSSAS